MSRCRFGAGFLRAMFKRRVETVMQTEGAECGLACLTMIARYHGHDIDLNTLRKTSAVSLKGASLAQVMQLAGQMHLQSRPLRLDMDHLAQLQLPAILHWDLNHFVVLTKVTRAKIHIIDPGRGVRILAMSKVSDHFTGVALELTPAADFNAIKNRLQPRLSDLWSRLIGLKGALFQTLSLSIVLQVAALAAPFYLQLVIDRAVTPSNHDVLLGLLIGFGGLVALRALTEAVRGWVILVYGNQISMQMIGNIFRHLVRLPAAYFEKRHIGDIVSRINSARPIQEALTESVVAIVLDGLMAALTLIIMYLYAPILCAAVLGFSSLFILVTILLYPAMRRSEEEVIVTKAIENSHVIESIRAATTVKLFGREAAREAAWRNLFADTVNAAIVHGRYLIGQKFFETLLTGLMIVVTVYLGARIIMTGGALTLGMLFAFIGYQQHFTESLKKLLTEGIKVRLLSLHLQRLADIIYERADTAAGSETINTCQDIHINDVSFRYGDQDPWVLKNLDLTIKRGGMTAITGVSGGGKTTLMKLILGLYPPTTGAILIGETLLSPDNAGNWRQKIGVVMQDDLLLSGTIADNISFFDPQMDMQKVYRAAIAAQIHDEICAIPMNYLSLVGDMGSVLSGGQRQRVLLARALYHDPDILILDEGTANLDPETEMKIADILQSMPITRIVVAHRPELIKRADTTIRLNEPS